ncbi:MAG: hypothetical protein R6V03_04325 [Kiritimatiellia bacterium]
MIKQHANPQDHAFIRSGMYYRQVKAYLDSFPKVKVLLFEEFRDRTREILVEALDFLGLKGEDYEAGDVNVVYNASGEVSRTLFRPIHSLCFRNSALKTMLKTFIPYSLRQRIKSSLGGKVMRKENMPEEVRNYLQRVFEPDIRALSGIFRDPGKKRIIDGWSAPAPTEC